MALPQKGPAQGLAGMAWGLFMSGADWRQQQEQEEELLWYENERNRKQEKCNANQESRTQEGASLQARTHKRREGFQDVLHMARDDCPMHESGS
jgi:hypothetical protein